jgi:DNA-binding response OmpR family regulator
MSDYTILLIDYDPKSIQHIEGLMRAAGHRVEVAKTGAAGLEAFRRNAPSLVLVEAMLPKKHGFEVCQEIKASPEGATTPVVILTAVYRGRKYRSQAFHLYRCDEYLEKPIEDARLMDVVEGFLSRSDPKQRPASAAPAVTGEKNTAASDPDAAGATAAETKSAPKSSTGNGDRSATTTADTQTHQKETETPEREASATSHADESMAEFTEEDIMSTLDAIMPDDKPEKTASS